jgi:hypothetical protein
MTKRKATSTIEILAKDPDVAAIFAAALAKKIEREFTEQPKSKKGKRA